MPKISKISNAFVLLILLAAAGYSIFHFWQWRQEVRVLKEVVERLSSDSRIAEVLVTKSELNEAAKRIETTIKFLEYDSLGRPLAPRYFTFEGNVIQFQTLVIRFADELVKTGDKFRGKSAYLFMKAFVLDPERPRVFDINKVRQIPSGYKIAGENPEFEVKLWNEFWDFALDPAARSRWGIKNAQIEAPGSLFLPGMIYTLKIEHDGGIRIDAEPLPEILKGERL